MTVQLLISSGCRVIGFDFDEDKVKLANSFGAIAFNSSNIDPVKITDEITDGIGVDSVLITASTKSNDVISQSANMCRKRGKIVLVGVVGLDIKRADFYKKELTFQVSCSYGPGRYDDDYEVKGIDYPLPYVRWTEQRNFDAILYTLACGALEVKPLITEIVPLCEYLKIYDNLGGKSIASLLVYDSVDTQNGNTIKVNSLKSMPSKGILGVIGSGNFTKMTLMPALKNSGAYYKYICSNGGLTAKSLASKYGFEFSTTDYKQILNDDDVDCVLITTRHDLHAQLVIQSIIAGKNVFVEKPLAITPAELNDIIDTYNSSNKPVSLTVGYNRRFSPFSVKAKTLLGGESLSPINMIATVNAGFIPADFWTQNMKVGGGRIIGEACHFVDLMIYLTGSLVKSVVMSSLGNNPPINTDNAIITLKFENGSQGVINYFSNGAKSYPKERIEIYSQSRTIIIDNFRKIEAFGFKGFSSKSAKLDKGHKNQFEKLVQQLKMGGEPLIPIEELINSAKTTFAALESLQKGNWVDV